MIPEQGEDTIDTSDLLPKWFRGRLDTSILAHDSFSLPRHLDPILWSGKRQALTQYQLYSLLNRHGNCYCEVHLSGQEKIDLVWRDYDRERTVGIEIKSLPQFDVRELEDQVDRYRSYTPLNVDYAVTQSGVLHDSESLYLFDAVWSALPQDRAWPESSNGERIGDGWLRYNHLESKLKFTIAATDRDTIHMSDYFRRSAEKEAEIKATLWEYFQTRGGLLTAEARFIGPPAVRRLLDDSSGAESDHHSTKSGWIRSSGKHVRRDSQTSRTPKQAIWERYDGYERQADIIVGNEHAIDGIDRKARICGIEAKKDITNSSQIRNQLQDYIRSQLFSEVYLAVPEEIASQAQGIIGDFPDIGLLGVREDADSGASVRKLVDANELQLDSVPFSEYNFEQDGSSRRTFIE